MRTTDEQVRRLRAERARGRSIEVAAMRAGMHRNTARKYVSDALPSERKKERTWRTREDPFAEDWAEMAQMLKDAPSLEAKALFEYLQGLRPGRYQEGHLRTFQRRVKRWRATHGPEKEIFFPQAHRAGEAFQTDFTHAKVLRITILCDPYDHQLCVTTLPYSNWRWATPCQSESMLAISEGLQNAAYELGRRSTRPTTPQILRVFDALDQHVILADGAPIKTVDPILTALLEEVLALLGVPAHAYGGTAGRGLRNSHGSTSETCGM